MKTRSTRRTHLRVALLVMASLVLLACGTSKHVPAAAPKVSGSWPHPNDNIGNTREAPGSTISSANVSPLRQASTFTLSGAAASGVSGFGSLAGAPIVESGVVYIQDLDLLVGCAAVP
jgi:hypothetical protein